MRLHQLLTVEKDTKSAALKGLTEAYHRIEKSPILSGISRRYRPMQDGGEALPPESTLVQLRVEDTFPEISGLLGKLFDLTLQKETANQGARADVTVEGVPLLKDVPVCALLFLEKQVTDLATFVDKLPVLDPSEQWEKDSSQNCWATKPVETHRTKKLPKVIEKSPATDKHPAQVEVFHEDVVVGYWSTVKFSGALPAERKAALKDRVAKLRSAVKIAREGANTIVVDEQHKMGSAVLNYLFNK